MRDGEAWVCSREEMREDRALGVGQAVKDVKWGSTAGQWQLRISRGVGGEASMTGLAAGATTCTAFFPYVA